MALKLSIRYGGVKPFLLLKTIVHLCINLLFSSIEEIYSVMGKTHKINAIKIKMEERNVLKVWNHKCDNESDAVRFSVQVRELCGWRDKCNCTFLDKVECKTIIDFLWTD